MSNVITFKPHRLTSYSAEVYTNDMTLYRFETVSTNVASAIDAISTTVHKDMAIIRVKCIAIYLGRKGEGGIERKALTTIFPNLKTKN